MKGVDVGFGVWTLDTRTRTARSVVHPSDKLCVPFYNCLGYTVSNLR